MFLGKETASGITVRTFRWSERSSSFSRGVDGIDEYEYEDDDGGDDGGGDGGRRENMTICWPHTGLARPSTSVILWASCGPVESLQPSGRLVQWTVVK